jgi:hypothetical protein
VHGFANAGDGALATVAPLLKRGQPDGRNCDALRDGPAAYAYAAKHLPLTVIGMSVATKLVCGCIRKLCIPVASPRFRRSPQRLGQPWPRPVPSARRELYSYVPMSPRVPS